MGGAGQSSRRSGSSERLWPRGMHERARVSGARRHLPPSIPPPRRVESRRPLPLLPAGDAGTGAAAPARDK